MNGYQAYVVLHEASLKSAAHRVLTSIGPGKHWSEAKALDAQAAGFENDSARYNRWADHAQKNKGHLRFDANLAQDTADTLRQSAKHQRRVGNLQAAGLGLAAAGTTAYAIHKARQKAAEKREKEDEK